MKDEKRKIMAHFKDLFGFVILLDVELAIEIALERFGAVEEAAAGERRAGRRTGGAAAGRRRPFAGGAGRRFGRRFPLAKQLALSVDLLAQRAQLLLPLGQLLESVAVRPVFLEGGAHPLRDKLAQPQPVLHAARPGLLLLDRRFLDEQPLDHVDALLDGSLLLVDHFLLGRHFGCQLFVRPHQFVYPVLFQLQFVLLLAFVPFN